MYDGGKLAGRFYLDMHPAREQVQPRRAVRHPAPASRASGFEAALVCVTLRAASRAIGLCEYDDVETFFHEFGHLLHAVRRRTPVGRRGRHQDRRDFVRAPSQMLEEWVRSPQVLAMFAKHYQTGEPIPATLVQQMNRADAFARALDVRRQMVYAGVARVLRP